MPASASEGVHYVGAPPKVASRDALPPARVFISPTQQSTSQWGSKIKITFQDISGIQGHRGKEGWVPPVREGYNWDRAASEDFGIPIKVVDEKYLIETDSELVLKCMPNYEQVEVERPSSFKSLPTGRSFTVAIQVQLGEQRIQMRGLKSSLGWEWSSRPRDRQSGFRTRPTSSRKSHQRRFHLSKQGLEPT
jgi:hypothetical protein